MAEARTIHVGLLLVFLLLVLAASVPQQDLPLFGHGLGGRLAHRALPTYFSLIVAVVCTHVTRQSTVAKTADARVPSERTGGVKPLVTCSPFPLGPPLAGLFWLAFLCLLPSFIIVVTSCIFVLFLSKVIVLLVAAKVVCGRDRGRGFRRRPRPAAPGQSVGTPLPRLTCWIIFGFGQLVVRLLAAEEKTSEVILALMEVHSWGGPQGFARTHLSSWEFFERLSLGSWGAGCTFFGSLSPYSSSRSKSSK